MPCISHASSCKPLLTHTRLLLVYGERIDQIKGNRYIWTPLSPTLTSAARKKYVCLHQKSEHIIIMEPLHHWKCLVWLICHFNVRWSIPSSTSQFMSKYVFDDLIRSRSMVELRSRDLSVASRSTCMSFYASWLAEYVQWGHERCCSSFLSEAISQKRFSGLWWRHTTSRL